MQTSCPVCGAARVEQSSVCHSCGFRFLDATQGFAPIAAVDENPQEKASEAHAILRIIRGPQTGHVFELTKQITVVGRKPSCDIFLNDMTVSREHAFIAASDKGYVISDKNSYNGVWINNEAYDKKVLVDRDVIQIGTFCLIFES